jgi:hypothetical protein
MNLMLHNLISKVCYIISTKMTISLLTQFFHAAKRLSEALMSNRITVNGQTFEVENGKSISVINGVLKVDGKVIVNGLSGDVRITFDGDLASLNCDTVTINGNVQGDVNCDTINCGNIGGNVNADTVNCKNVSGSIKADTVVHG